MSCELMVMIRGNIVYKSTKLACFFGGLPSFLEAAPGASKKPRSDMNILNLDLQSLGIRGNQKIRSTVSNFPRVVFPRLLSGMKNTTCKLFFLAFLQILLGFQQANATTYYVSTSGNDANSGTSLTAPVRTINKALSKASLSGDIVYVRTGTYVETVSIQQSGITLSAYPGDKPVVDGQTTLPNKDWGALVFVSGNNNTVSGFEVKNSNINGIRLGGYSVVVTGHHNTISKINAHHAWESGVRVQGDYNIVEDSLMWQTVVKNSYNNGSVTGGWGAGLSAARNYNASALIPGITSYPILRRNKVFNNWGEGVICFEADHCTLEDNIVYDNWTVNLYLSDATNSLVQRNIVYVSSAPAIPTRNNSRPGVFLADEKATVPRSTKNTIINNFVYNANFEAFTWSGVANAGLNNVLIANNTIVDGGLFIGSGGSNAIVHKNSQIRNNIIFGKNSSVLTNSGITFSNNNWARTSSLAATVTDIVGDPQIARTGTTTPGTLTSSYFKILESSPVIDAATPINNVTKDFFQVARGTTPDIGGHELSSNAISSPSTPANCTQIAINVSGAVSDGGYSKMLGYTFGTPADNKNFNTQSTLRLFENGWEMGPEHSSHADIRNMGAGRFSHWSQVDGTGESIRFSASDNTNPLTNGKKYSYCLK